MITGRSSADRTKPGHQSVYSSGMPRSAVSRILTRLLLVIGAFLAVPPTAKAQSPKRVLYVTHVGPNAHAHESRLRAVDILTSLGQSTGAFTVTHMPDASQL